MHQGSICMIRQAGTYINKYINLWMALTFRHWAVRHVCDYLQPRNSRDGESYSINRWMDGTRISRAAVHTSRHIFSRTCKLYTKSSMERRARACLTIFDELNTCWWGLIDRLHTLIYSWTASCMGELTSRDICPSFMCDSLSRFQPENI